MPNEINTTGKLPATTQAQEFLQPPDHIVSRLRNFEYSDFTRRQYLYTRKSVRSFAYVDFPGLFVEPLHADFYAFLLACLIEFVAAAVLAAMFASAFHSAWLSGAIAFGLVFLDIVVAIVNHVLLTRSHCLRENQKLLITPAMRVGHGRTEHQYQDFLAQVKSLQLSASKISLASIMFWFTAFIIVGLAMVKALSLSANLQELGSIFSQPSGPSFLAPSSGFDSFLQDPRFRYGMVGLFIVLYGLVAYIHLFHTGWAFSAMWLSMWQKLNENWRNKPELADKYMRKERHIEINLHEFIRELRTLQDQVYAPRAPSPADEDAVIRAGLRVQYTEAEWKQFAPHVISKTGEGIYRITSKGDLTDDNLAAMIQCQHNEFAKFTVAMWGHALQLDSIGALDVHGS